MNFLKGTQCYLSGPIACDNTKTNWRTPVIEYLTQRFGINVFDPFSDPKQQKSILIKEAKEARDKQKIQQLVSGFVRKDLGQVDRSDFVIARFAMETIYYANDIEDYIKHSGDSPLSELMVTTNCKYHLRQVPTTGTIHEIINADLYHKPVLLVCEEGWWNLPEWLMGFINTEYWFSSWQELFTYLNEVDMGNKKDDDRWHLVYKLV